MKIFGSLLICLFIVVSSHSQNLTGGDDAAGSGSTTLGNADSGGTFGTTRELGMALLSSLQTGDADKMRTLLISREDFLATVEAQTTDMNVKYEVSRGVDSDFDRRVTSEVRQSVDLLRARDSKSRSGMDWSQTSFTEFVFQQDETESRKYNIIMGSGILKFTYQGSPYQLEIGKVAQLINGWRFAELGSSAEPM